MKQDMTNVLTLLLVVGSVVLLAVVLSKLHKKNSSNNSSMRAMATPGACVEPSPLGECTACDLSSYTQEDPSGSNVGTVPVSVLYEGACLPGWTAPGVKNAWKNSQYGRNDCYQYCGRENDGCQKMCDKINP